MFMSIKRGLVASAVAIVLIVPSAASAFMRTEVGGSSATHAAPLTVVHIASLAPGFQWADAGIGAAVVALLVIAGSGVALTVRGRTHRQLVR